MYLCDHSLPGAIVFEKEVICLDEELTGIFLWLCCTTSPQDHWPISHLVINDMGYLLLRKQQDKQEFNGEDRHFWAQRYRESFISNQYLVFLCCILASYQIKI